jgi:hypothetical protein
LIVGTILSPQALSSLWGAAGLIEIQTKQLSMGCDFASFDDYWLRALRKDLQQRTSEKRPKSSKIE